MIEPVLPVEGDHPTANPDGVTNSIPDYYPKTQEEKAALLGVTFATTLDVVPDEPYPDGDPLVEGEDDRLAYLARLHSPMELVQAADMDEQHILNLKAGGSVELADVKTIADG